MGAHHNLLRPLPKLVVVGSIFAVVLLLDPLFSGRALAQAPVEAASPDYSYRIKILSVESLPINGGTPVPKNCDLQNFDAYCNQSRDPSRKNTMLVQGSDGTSFSITCTLDSRWSKCVPLPAGETFDAKKGKHGITVLYKDSKGKDRNQLYQVVTAAPNPKSIAATSTQPHPAVPVRESTKQGAPLSTSGTVESIPAESVKCKFSSIPSGAEITVDDKYMGNTPSTISLGPGTHDLALSLAGFAQWKRQLTITAGSDVDVTATLQKAQQ